ncbi:MAG: hypothetical protein ACI82F_004539 [Planctomycetota bacterium]|jgi:hypothetical protein
MNRAIEIGAMILGSASLLLVSFLGFAVMSGVPLHEVAVIGGLFEGPPEVDADENASMGEYPDSGARAQATTRSPESVIAGSMGLMSAYALPSPYTQAGLQELTDEVKRVSLRLDSRDIELDRREAELAETEDGYEQRLLALEDLQKSLDRFQRDLLERELEVMRDEDAKDQSEVQRFADIAKVLDSFESSQRVGMLTSYEPDEAALILVALSEDILNETMAALSVKLSAELMREYVEAYSNAVQNLGTK